MNESQEYKDYQKALQELQATSAKLTFALGDLADALDEHKDALDSFIGEVTPVDVDSIEEEKKVGLTRTGNE